MPTIDAPPVPAVLSALAAARSTVRDAGVAPVWSLRDDELATAAAQTLALAAQVNGMLSAVLAETDGRDLAGRLEASTTAAWHARGPAAHPARGRRCGPACGRSARLRGSHRAASCTSG